MGIIYEVEYGYFISHTIFLICLIGGFFVFSIYFYLRMREKAHGSDERFIFRGYCLFFLFYSGTRIFYMLADFVTYYARVDETPGMILYTGIAYCFGILSVICFSYAHEKTTLPTRLILTYIWTGVLILCILSIFYIISLNLTRIIVTSSVLVFFIIFLFYYIYIAIKSPEKHTPFGGLQSAGELRNRAIFIVVGYVIFLVGIGIDSRFGNIFLASIGFPYAVQLSITPLIILTGGAVFTFSQREALVKIAEVKGIFVISKDGICMVEQKFKDILVDAQLITGVIASIGTIIKESVYTKKKLKMIDHEDVKILIEWGTQVHAAIIADKETSDLRNNLKKFLTAFEEKYKLAIKQWSGDLDIFSNIDKLIENHFGVYIPKK
ncbi:MAG: hypothetical protein ACFFDN_05405 [Candidatus Hodarchaeota archaeon]